MKKTIIAKDGTRFLVREPKTSDLKQIMNMFNRTIVEPGIGLNMKKKATLKEEKAWLKGTLTAIKKKEKVDFIMEKDGKIVGNAEIRRRAMNTKESHTATFGIMIAKEVRDKGLAQRIIPILIDIAKKRMKGLEIVELEVFETNKRAQHVYEKMGFKTVGMIPHKVKTKEGYQGSVIMLKHLKKIGHNLY